MIKGVKLIENRLSPGTVGWVLGALLEGMAGEE